MRQIKHRPSFIRIPRLMPRLLSAIEIAAAPYSTNTRCRKCGCELGSSNHWAMCLDEAQRALVIAEVDRRRCAR